MAGPGALWKDACISVRKLFFTFHLKMFPIAPPPTFPKGSSRTTLWHLTNVSLELLPAV